MKKVRFRDQELPYWVAEGQHSQYIIPIAKKVCEGVGLDVGAGREDWAFPGSFPIDPKIHTQYNAYKLPFRDIGWDYIFSSHCLEHLEHWEAALCHWTEKLRVGGKLFLYLPHEDCLYWRPENMPNGKHVNQFTPKMIKEVLYDLGYIDVFASQRDLAWSFAAFGTKS